MKFHTVAATLALVATVSLSSAAFAAPVTSINAPVHAFFGKPQKVSLTLHNDGKESLTVTAGSQELTLKPGEETSVKLVAGDKVIAKTASADHAVGDILVFANSELNGATVRIK